jgi:short-subunit dehydrogenase
MSDGSQTRTAVVTGATGGLGACFARRLAQQGYSLLLTDRFADQLEKLREDLTPVADAPVEIVPCDLADDAQLESLAKRIASIEDLELLINNAGFATVGNFADIDEDVQSNMTRVHTMAPTRLARAALPGMIERDRGAIVNVSSLGAWLPAAGCVQYSATKAYLVTFSEALREELLGTNVQVQVLCPGFVKSGFHESDTMSDFDKNQVPSHMWSTPEPVVDYSLKSLTRKRLVAIPGWRNRLMGRLLRMPALRPIVLAVTRQKG